MRAPDIKWMIRTKRVKLTWLESLTHYFLLAFPGMGVVVFGYACVEIAFGIYDGRKASDEIVTAFLICSGLTLIAFFYKYRQLKLKTITVEHDVDHFQDAVRRTAKQRDWSLESDKAHFVRAFRIEPGFVVTGEMITLIREDNTLYLNSVSNPDLRPTFSSFRQDKKNLRQFLINLQESILDIAPNDAYEKQEQAKAHAGRFIRTLAAIFSVIMIVGGAAILSTFELSALPVGLGLISIGVWYLQNDWNLKKEQERLDNQRKK